MGWNGYGAGGGVEMLMGGFMRGMDQIIATRRENIQREEEFEMSWLYEYNNLVDKFNEVVRLHNAQWQLSSDNYNAYVSAKKDSTENYAMYVQSVKERNETIRQLNESRASRLASLRTIKRLEDEIEGLKASPIPVV